MICRKAQSKKDPEKVIDMFHLLFRVFLGTTKLCGVMRSIYSNTNMQFYCFLSLGSIIGYFLSDTWGLYRYLTSMFPYCRKACVTKLKAYRWVTLWYANRFKFGSIEFKTVQGFHQWGKYTKKVSIARKFYLWENYFSNKVRVIS